MSTARTRSSQPPADITKTAAGHFPLVHKLIHFADLRNFYKDMREALISANRRAGAQQGLVTKAKRKIAALGTPAAPPFKSLLKNAFSTHFGNGCVDHKARGDWAQGLC
jgi:hypothetical protein